MDQRRRRRRKPEGGGGDEDGGIAEEMRQLLVRETNDDQRATEQHADAKAAEAAAAERRRRQRELLQTTLLTSGASSSLSFPDGGGSAETPVEPLFASDISLSDEALEGRRWRGAENDDDDFDDEDDKDTGGSFMGWNGDGQDNGHDGGRAEEETGEGQRRQLSDASRSSSSPPTDDGEHDDDDASSTASSVGVDGPPTIDDLRRRRKERRTRRGWRSRGWEGRSGDGSGDDDDDEKLLAMSLPARPLNNFPSEGDRKCIVGCLAAILTSAYDYDDGEGEDAATAATEEDNTGMAEASEAVAEMAEGAAQERNEDGTSVDVISPQQSQQQPRSFSRAASNLEGSVYGDGAEPQMDVGEGEEDGDDTDRLSRASSAASSSRDIEGDGDAEDKESGWQSRRRRPRWPPRTPRRRSSLDSGANKRRGGTAGAPSPATGGLRSRRRNAAEIAVRALERHRIRRHELLTDFLLSAAKLLFLDVSHAKAFLPMLDRLLTPGGAGAGTTAGSSGGVGSAAGPSSPTTTRSSLSPPRRIPDGGRSRGRFRGLRGRRSGSTASEDGGGITVGSMLIQPLKSAAAPSGISGTVPMPDGSIAAAAESPVPLSTGGIGGSRGEDPLSRTSVSAPSPDLRMMPLPGSDSGTSIFENERSSAADLQQQCHIAIGKEGATGRSESFRYGSAGKNTTRENGAAGGAETATAGGHLGALVNEDLIHPFLSTLTPGAGFQCISLLLLHHLLRSENGYDARIRHIFKRLAVVVIMYEMQTNGYDDDDEEDDTSYDCGIFDGIEASRRDFPRTESLRNAPDHDLLALKAARKFEALEHAVAAKLLNLSSSHQQQKNGGSSTQETKGQIVRAKRNVSREQIIRGIKIGSAGVVAGTLFALTGGLAAPGIAAGIAAVAGSTAAATAAVVTLTSTAAVTAIFGVGGAGLAGYKMHRRTKGLTEFDFQKESGGRGGGAAPSSQEAELFSTICISGWLKDGRDFQRPWGVVPSNPPIRDKQELLERFYYVYKPENVHRCSRILQHWRRRERQLWRVLKHKYGRDPDHVFPLDDGPRIRATLTHEENEVLEMLLGELGYAQSKVVRNAGQRNAHSFGHMSEKWKHNITQRQRHSQGHPSEISPHVASAIPFQPNRRVMDDPGSLADSLQGSHAKDSTSVTLSSSVSFGSGDNPSTPVSGLTSPRSAPSFTANQQLDKSQEGPPLPKHLATAYDYQSQYGGELYTVRWESHLLLELCDSVTDMAVDAVGGATKEILKQTALASLMTAIALPYALVQAANMIDGTWTLAIERADEAGVELAKSLIVSQAGHRPVTLVGFSMGARTIYACLKELARHQEKWEDQREARKSSTAATSQRHRNGGTLGSNESSSDSDEESVKYMREPASIVEDVILMGTPNHVSIPSWEACRRVVAGRLINCYSKKDMILSLMFQFKRIHGILRPVCGTSPVNVAGVENFDVTDLVTSHSDYCISVGEILKLVGHGQPQHAAHFCDADNPAPVDGIDENASLLVPLSDEVSNN